MDSTLMYGYNPYIGALSSPYIGGIVQTLEDGPYIGAPMYGC